MDESIIVFNALICAGDGVLVVRKRKDRWVLVGRRVNSEKEGLDLLYDKIRRDLPGTKLDGLGFYGNFSCLENGGDRTVLSHTYIGHATGIGKPRGFILDKRIIYDGEWPPLSGLAFEALNKFWSQRRREGYREARRALG